jgi:SAM-dependent methyltransferase
VAVTPRPRFDRLAPAYQALERVTFGGLLHWCRTAHLARLGACRRALVLGDGDGRFLADLLRANPEIEADSLDISAGMLALARRRVAAVPGGLSRVRFVRADARTDSLPGAGYDLVVTNFFLDCFRPAELAAVVRRGAAGCAPGATWVDGDFRVPPGGWERVAAKALLAAMYTFFCVATRLPARRLTDPAPLLEAEGFALAGEASRLRGFLSARLWVRAATATPGSAAAYDGSELSHGPGLTWR